MADDEQVMFMLGQIKGQLEGMNKRLDKIDQIDERLANVETKAAVNGAIAGGVFSVGVSIIVTSIREAFRTSGT